ncbi:MAG TPA: hypothetical protein VGM59_16810 [Dongiaceae bacterium]|jgi:hypothetical protein
MAWKDIFSAALQRNRLDTKKQTHIVPAQAAFASIPVNSTELAMSGLSVAHIEVETNCPAIGVYPLANGRMLTAELVFSFTQRRQKLFVFLPAGTQQIDLRNATNVASPSSFRIVGLDYLKFDDLSDFSSPAVAKMIQNAEKSVLIHSLGKTGSISMHQMLSGLDGVISTRGHFFNLANIPMESDHPGSAVFRTLTPPRLSSFRMAMHMLKRGFSHPHSLDVICGIRRSDTQSLAAAFQTHGALFMEIDLSASDAISFVYRHVGTNLSHFWWETEFLRSHGFSLDQLADGLVRDNLTWNYKAPSGINYRFYRIEDGDEALRECLMSYARFAPDPASFPGKIARSNLGMEKGYAALYEAVKEQVDFDRLLARRSPLMQRIDGLFYGR